LRIFDAAQCVVRILLPFVLHAHRRSVEQLDLVGEVARGEVRVAHRHLQRLVAEQLGNGTQLGAAHHQPGREGVPQIVKAEVFEEGVLDRRVKAPLQVLERRGRLLALPVDENIDLVLLRVPEPLERGAGGRAERDRVRPAVLGPRYAGDPVVPVDPARLQAKEVATPEACVDREFDGVAKERRASDSRGLGVEELVLVLGQLPQSLDVRPEELHALHRVVGGQALLDRPVEQATQHLQASIDARFLHLLGTLQLHRVDHGRRDPREMAASHTLSAGTVYDSKLATRMRTCSR